MPTSRFPGMDPFLEEDPAWQIFHGWFIRKLAEQSIAPARELGCQVDVERSIYGREPSGELVLIGEPDVLAFSGQAETEYSGSNDIAPSLEAPRSVHEVLLDPDEMETYKQEYIVIRDADDFARVLAVVELLSFANKQGSYVPKYREKRSWLMASRSHFMEIDFLRDGENPSRDLFPELPKTPYFVFVARKTETGRNEEGYAIRLQDPLPTIGLPLGPQRPDLPMDMAAAFRSAYDLSYRRSWQRDQESDIPGPPLSKEDLEWVQQVLRSDG